MRRYSEVTDPAAFVPRALDDRVESSYHVVNRVDWHLQDGIKAFCRANALSSDYGLTTTV